MIFARAAAAFGGITAQAVYIALGVTAVIGGIMFGIYSYGSYRENLANTRWELRMANARIADQAKRVLRDRKQFEVALKNAQEWAAAMAQSEAARIDAERLLGEQRKIVWPKAVVRTINQ